MKFLIVSKQDSETGADNYTELELKNFKTFKTAAKHVMDNYSKDTKLYKLSIVHVDFKKEK